MTTSELPTSVTPDVLDRFRAVPSANVGDAMHRLGALDGGIQASWPGARVVGTAFTVWTRSGDNLMLHEALAHVKPGDVLVVNGHGDTTRALIGELIAGRAKARGVIGFVIDGVVRDADALMELDMPVFARGVSPAGPYKNGPGALGRTIAVGGVAVSPGDVIVADADGVVVVPSAEASSVLAAAEQVRAVEDQKRADIAAEIAASPHNT